MLVSIVGGVELIGFGFLLCFYGLYFGVLCRDSAEIACELVVAKLGYYRKGNAFVKFLFNILLISGAGWTVVLLSGTSMPLRSLSDDVCALCDSSLGVDPNIVLSLPCGHRYHSACLKVFHRRCFIIGDMLGQYDVIILIFICVSNLHVYIKTFLSATFSNMLMTWSMSHSCIWRSNHMLIIVFERRAGQWWAKKILAPTVERRSTFAIY